MKLPKRATHLLQLGLSYLSMLSIRSKRIYVFGAWKGQTFSDNPKYLYLQAQKHKDLKPVWITRSKGIYRQLKEKGLPVHMYNSTAGLYYQLRASVFFTCMSKEDVLITALGNATRMNLWHGVGLKKILHDDKITKRNYNTSRKSKRQQIWQQVNVFPRRKEFIFSTSDQMTTIFSGAFKLGKEKILQLGQPRNDVFFSDDLEVETFPFAGRARQIILYMPTHRHAGKQPMQLASIMNLEVLNAFCQRHDLLFLVKKHYYHNQEREQLDGYERIIDITHVNFDGQVLLKHANLLITDYSSCFVDYLLLNRPVIFYNYDHAAYVLNDRDFYFDYRTTTPGPKATEFPSLMQHLEAVLVAGSDPYEAERKRVRDLFYAPDNQQLVSDKILAYVKQHC